MERQELRQAVLQSVRASRQAGETSRKDARRIWVATLLPGVLKEIEDLVVMQAAVTASERVSYTADGTVDRSMIDWTVDDWIKLIEALIPLIIKLIGAF